MNLNFNAMNNLDEYKLESPYNRVKLTDEGFEDLTRCCQCLEHFSMDDLTELSFSTPHRKHNDLCCEYCVTELTNNLSLIN